MHSIKLKILKLGLRWCLSISRSRRCRLYTRKLEQFISMSFFNKKKLLVTAFSK